jgi:F5/8 type C domain/HEAT repeats
MTFPGKKRLALTGLLVLVFLSLLPGAWSAPDKEELAADEKVLKDAGIAPDEPGLLEFFKKQTGTESQRRLIGELIKQLGDDDFMVREKATRELIGLGPVARTALQQARKHEDAEVSARAERCLEALSNGSHSELLVSAARVLSTRKSAKAAEVLLAFLPTAAASGVEEDIIQAVTVLAVNDGKAHPALVQALTDALPLRRAAAGEALARAGLPEHSEAVRKLLKDAEPAVRLRVSLVLVCSGDRNGVPVLIDLLPHLTRDQAWQAEDIFYRLDAAKAPRLPLGDEVAERKKYRDECLAWWKEHGAKADLALLEGDPRRKAKMRARASQSWENNTPDKAIDGDRRTVWNAGNPPPPGGAGQWIELDLGALRRLGGLLMVTSQLPDGPTTHEIWVSTEPIGEDRTRARLVHTFKGPTKSGDVFRFDFPKRLSGRYVQVRTTDSPSWVSWSEIELGVR